MSHCSVCMYIFIYTIFICRSLTVSRSFVGVYRVIDHPRLPASTMNSCEGYLSYLVGESVICKIVVIRYQCATCSSISFATSVFVSLLIFSLRAVLFALCGSSDMVQPRSRVICIISVTDGRLVYSL